MFRRLIRTACRAKLSLQEHRRQNVLKPDRESIKSRINSLYEVFDQDENPEKPSVSKFRLNRQIAEVAVKPTNLDSKTILNFIQSELSHESLNLYKRHATGEVEILFNASSCSGRKAAAETIMKAFKDLVPDRRIAVEGLKSKDADWIVILLGNTKIHIFDATKRHEVDLDGLLSRTEQESEFDFESFKQRVSSMPPKSITCKPELVEKYLRKKSAQ